MQEELVGQAFGVKEDLKKIRSSYRLSIECRRLLKLLATTIGVSQTGIVEMSVREKARRVLKYP